MKQPLVYTDNCGVIMEANGNTTILNPCTFFEVDQSSEFISQHFNAPVFSFQILDGEIWLYAFFVNGKVVDYFLPEPDCFVDENILEEDLEGNAATITNYIKGTEEKEIKKYLIRRDLRLHKGEKAYPDDAFEQNDWRQLLDFMRKLNLPYPLDNEGSPKGDIFEMIMSNYEAVK